MKTFRSIFIYCLVILALVEIGLRLTGKLKTYSEKNFELYRSAYSTEGVKPLYLWSKNDSIRPRQVEFDFEYHTNAYGLVDDRPLHSCDKGNSLIYLGDSFVFGVGAPQDSSLPRLLENRLGTTIVNAGIPGSDPFFEKRLIDSIFAPLGFQHYLLMVNFSDIQEYLIRGGEERFSVQGEVNYRESPWIETPYQYSYIVRAIVHGILKYDFSLISPAESKKLRLEAVNAYSQLLSEIATKHELIVVLQPYPRQYTQSGTVLSQVLDYAFLEELNTQLQAKGVRSIDLNTQLQTVLHAENYLDYSWQLDGHYNSKGYALLSEILANELTLKYPEFSKPERKSPCQN